MRPPPHPAPAGARRLLLGGALAVLALAAGAPAPDADLGGELTPLGAIRAGNAEGTIPEWTGGITEPPAGYTVGDHHPNPFPDDPVQFSITGANAQEFADKLSPGQLAMLTQYPTWRMDVYQTRRTAAFPQRVYDASIANHQSARLVADGNGVEGASVTSPFPVPETGVEAVWNHILRYRGESITRRSGQANPTSGGSYTMVMFEDQLFFPYALGAADGNVFTYLIQHVVQPARLAGEILLVHETLNQVAGPRQVWTYNPGQRRVRRAPNIAYDNPGTASDGLRTNDQLDIFNGAPDRYEWTLKGRRELYVPYNSYDLHSDQLSYDDVIRPNHLNPDHLRYELHRVWEVEGVLRDGTNHIYSRRVFFLDEDSWQIVVADHYDSRGELWRVAEAHVINYYEVPNLWSTLDVIYDLQSGRYTGTGFDNEETMYNFSADLATNEFTPSQLRRQGRR